MGNLGGPRARRLAGSAEKGGRHSDRSAGIQRHRQLLGPKCQSFAPLDSAADCVEIFAGEPGKYRRFADPPPGRFFGEVAESR